MKSILKWFFLVFGLVVLLAACTVGLLFTPSVQRSIAHRVLNTDERSVEMESIAIGLRQIRVQNLSLVQPGLNLDLAELRMEWSPFAFISAGAVDIKQLRLRDLDVVLSEPPEKPVVIEPPVPVSPDEPDLRFAGLVLPEIPLTLGRLAANGKVRLADGSVVVWQAAGEGIAPMRIGTLTLKGTVTGDGLRTGVNASINIDQGSAGWNGARMNADFRAEVDDFAAPIEVNIVAALDRSPGREDVSVTVSRPVNQSVREELFTLRASLEGQQMIRGQGAINFDHHALVPFSGAGQTPDFTLRGDYELTYRIPSEVGSMRVALHGTAGNWGVVADDLAALPALDWQARFSGGWDHASFQVNDLNVAVAEAGNPSSVEVALSEAFRYNRGAAAASGGPTAALKESVSITFTDLRLGLINPLIAPQRVDGVVNGRLSAEVDGAGEQVSIRTIDRLRVTGLSYNKDGEPVIGNASLSLSPKVEVNGPVVRFEVADVDLAADRQSLVRAKTLGTFDQASRQLESSGEVVINVSGLMKQPLFAQAAASVPAGDWSAVAEWALRHGLENNRLAIDSLVARIADSGTDHFSLRLLQAFQANLTNMGDDPASLLDGVEGDVVDLTISRLPLGLIDPWVEAYSLAGTIDSAAVRVGKIGTEWALNTTSPVRVSGLTVASTDELLVRDVDMALALTAGSADERVFADIRSFEALSGGLRMIGASGRAALNPDEAGSLAIDHFSAQIDLPRLFSQPALLSRNNFLKGQMEVNVSGQPAPGGKVLMHMKGNDWRLREPLRAISSISAEVAADWAADGKIHLQGPLRVDGPGGTSSVNLSGWVDPTEDQKRFDLKLHGPRIVGEDLLLLAGAFSNPAYQGSTAVADSGSGAEGQSIELPFWGEWQGRLIATFETLLHAGFQIRQAETEVNLSHQKLDIPYLRGMLSDSQINGKVAIDYRPDQPMSYDMVGNLGLPNFDVGRHLRESTGSTPVIEGIFNLKSDFRSSGVDAADLVQRLRGNVDLSGENGLMRVLAATGRQETLGVVGAFSGLLGGQVRELRVMNDLIRFLEVVRYEKLSLQAVRGDRLDIDLTEFLVLGEELRFQGRGGIRYQEGVSVLNQPLRVETRLDGKNSVANLLGSLRLLRSQQPGADGFVQGPSFLIGGTPGSPDFSSLMQVIERAAMGLVTGGARQEQPQQTPPAAGEEASQPQEAAPQEAAPLRPEDAIRGLIEGFRRR